MTSFGMLSIALLTFIVALIKMHDKK
ncbi:MAG TPA: hypothetical protein GXX75_23855 [Clostridiales bacterium]|nr:hypothetical protein [Clostridiales bacterium]